MNTALIEWIGEYIGTALDDLIMIHIRFSFQNSTPVYRLEIFGNNHTKKIPDNRFSDAPTARLAAESWIKELIERSASENKNP